MFKFGMGELIVILMIVLVLFGASRLPEIAKALGKSIKEFKKAGKEIKEEFEDVTKEVEDVAKDIAKGDDSGDKGNYLG